MKKSRNFIEIFLKIITFRWFFTNFLKTSPASGGGGLRPRNLPRGYPPSSPPLVDLAPPRKKFTRELMNLIILLPQFTAIAPNYSWRKYFAMMNYERIQQMKFLREKRDPTSERTKEFLHMEEIDQNPRVTRKISNIFSGNVFKTRILIVLMSKRYLKISRVFRKNLLKFLEIEIIILLGCHDQILRIWRNSFDYCLLFSGTLLNFSSCWRIFSLPCWCKAMPSWPFFPRLWPNCNNMHLANFHLNILKTLILN